ncbi:universal stress protein [uncultured Azohydromonas sp.]|jgi:Universal stress protein UspA and related nucleotide-binding proteins|uniref:universal stress protein n=1 Tax=uncultured Azohydromonas sp. TaxID=487342 RepID=UPI00262832EB|nr:universal stress protein [uncultured Azohydromonas sp.]
MFRSILVAVDSSPAAHNAVRRASLLAAHFQARLILLQVLEPTRLTLPYGLFAAAVKADSLVTRAQLTLGRLAAEVARDHDIHVTVAVRVGNALEHVFQLALQADLLVIGAKTRNPFHDGVFGRRMQQLLQLARQPVLVVKAPTTAAYTQVLVPTDFSACGDASLRLALGMVPDASVDVFHALSTHRETKMRAAHVPADAILRYVESSREKCLRRLAAMVSRAGSQGVQSSVGHGDPLVLCLERQKAVAADLIVLGKEGQGQAVTGSSLMGSVARQVVAKARCDVLAIPRSALPQRTDGPSAQRPSAHFGTQAAHDEKNWFRRSAAPMGADCH